MVWTDKLAQTSPPMDGSTRTISGTYLAPSAFLLWRFRIDRLSGLQKTRILYFAQIRAILPSRPSAATARYGAHLRAAVLAPYEALNTWLAANITDGSTVVPERTLHAHEALCILTMFILKDKDVGSIFQGPDVYTLVLEIQLHGKSQSPLMRLGRFVGSSDDGDAPLWTRLFKPRESYHILETSTFAATLACGMTNIAAQSVSTETISARMRAWACNVSLGTCVDAAVVRHCIRLAFQEPPIINPEVGT
ncbi:hypothetical protein C8R44DRAFT_772596, partial [Mycena epipterygia]